MQNHLVSLNVEFLHQHSAYNMELFFFFFGKLKGQNSLYLTTSTLIV